MSTNKKIQLKKTLFLSFLIITILIIMYVYFVLIQNIHIIFTSPNLKLNNYIQNKTWIKERKLDENYSLMLKLKNKKDKIIQHTYLNKQDGITISYVIYEIHINEFYKVSINPNNDFENIDLNIMQKSEPQKNTYLFIKKNNVVSQNFNIMKIHNNKIENIIMPANVVYYENQDKKTIYLLYDFENKKQDTLLKNLEIFKSENESKD